MRNSGHRRLRPIREDAHGQHSHLGLGATRARGKAAGVRLFGGSQRAQIRHCRPPAHFLAFVPAADTSAASLLVVGCTPYCSPYGAHTQNSRDQVRSDSGVGRWAHDGCFYYYYMAPLLRTHSRGRRSLPLMSIVALPVIVHSLIGLHLPIHLHSTQTVDFGPQSLATMLPIPRPAEVVIVVCKS